MKKFIICFAAVITFSSCNKCQDCTIDGITSEVCQDDFDSNADYQAALLAAEELGADCK